MGQSSLVGSERAVGLQSSCSRAATASPDTTTPTWRSKQLIRPNLTAGSRHQITLWIRRQVRSQKIIMQAKSLVLLLIKRVWARCQVPTVQSFWTQKVSNGKCCCWTSHTPQQERAHGSGQPLAFFQACVTPPAAWSRWVMTWLLHPCNKMSKCGNLDMRTRTTATDDRPISAKKPQTNENFLCHDSLLERNKCFHEFKKVICFLLEGDKMVQLSPVPASFLPKSWQHSQTDATGSGCPRPKGKENNCEAKRKTVVQHKGKSCPNW